MAIQSTATGRRPMQEPITEEQSVPKRSWLRRPLLWAAAVLLAIAFMPVVGVVVVVRATGWTEKARYTKIRSDLRAIVYAAEVFRTATGRSPTSLEELGAGKYKNGEDIGSSLSLTRDPWNNDYLFQVDSNGRFRAICLGRDGAEGGEGEDQDYVEIEDGGR